ncbi:MAG TPA: PDZ domain-containing protein [Armatimonadota bacterium]|nr:PDZ domain-containing protein [Armatimonadota bacterium]
MRRFSLILAAFLALPTSISAAAAPSRSVPANLVQAIDRARSKVYPALVNISVVVRYFDDGRAQRTLAGGSGVIVTPDGYVLTNFHVAGHTTRITCTLPTGQSMDAATVLDDPLTDLSVLKLQRTSTKTPLPFARLGDSSQLRVGDFVLAMGNPLMLSSSMTFGIVSNTRRVFTDFTGTEIENVELDEGEQTGLLTRWIQHDALILPGNSGGPLVNLQGQVVGINELGGSGVGFAIPANLARRVLRYALHGEPIKRGWIGINILPVSKIQRTTGALVSFVVPSSPAQKAGILAGDIILSLNGAPVTARYFEEVPTFYRQISALPIGKPVHVRYLRGAQVHEAVVEVARLEQYIGKEEEVKSLGITIQQITPPMALIRRYPNANGVLVTSLRAGYPFQAAQPPVEEDDVVLAINGKPTPNLSSFQQAVARLGKQSFTVSLRRKDENLLTVVHPPDESAAEEGGELPHAWLGIQTQVVTPDVAAAIGMPGAQGFRITEVYPWSAASSAGLRVGDVITALNGQALEASRLQDASNLEHAIQDLNIGAKGKLAILRNHKSITIDVPLEAEPSSPSQAAKAQEKEFEFAVRDVTPYDRIHRRWSVAVTGVIVTDVTTGGWASVAGLQPDDLIESINRRTVNNVTDFKAVMKAVIAARPKVIRIFVRRGYLTQFVFIQPDWKHLNR